MRTMHRAAAGLTTLVIAALLLGCQDAGRGLTGPDPSVGASFDVSTSSASTVTTNDRVPLAATVTVPCANNGAGEVVLLTGTLHVLTHQTLSSSGNVHVKIHFQPQGVSGVGLTSGDTYRGTGVTQEESNLNGPLPITDTFIDNFRIIGPGPDNNFLVHRTIHVTINANGVVTAEVANISVECR